MSDDTNTEVTEESGSALRSRLEEFATANKELAEANQRIAAENVILRTGSTYVKPEDLVGVPVEEFAAKAAEIQAAKATEREAIFAEEARKRGIQFDETSATPAPAADPAIARAASLGNLGGTPPSQVQKPAVTPEDYLDRALSNPK